MDVSRLHFHDDGAGALALFHDEREHEPLLVHADAEAQYLLVENVKEGLPGEVGHKERPGLPLAPERADAQPSSVVAVEDHPHVLHGDNLVPRLAAHHLDGVLVAEIVATLDGVVGVVFPAVAAVGQGGVDASLSGVGVAPHRVHLRDDRHVHAVLAGSEGGPHSGQARPDHQHVMFIHPRLPRFLENLENNISRCDSGCQGGAGGTAVRCQ